MPHRGTRGRHRGLVTLDAGFVDEKDGTLRSFSMGVKKVGKWVVEKDQLCLYLGESDDGCYQVTRSGEQIELIPMGLGGSLDGILQPAYYGNGDT
ncbi:hypothetical protein [Bradyrhizobium sp. CCBAU 51627]|uniref:hypothetical protein n=1 Tax=Bradyrhizobium sp. CCBAU 51627 TaxID=1325088 RepID=UPI002305A032|nr:hypothetical protein [Bradyrhizobium sp. CCBAU 51627]